MFWFVHRPGIYVALFASSVKILLNKRKSISGAGTLLALAGVFFVLITWVRHAARPVISWRLIFIKPLTARHHGYRTNGQRLQEQPGGPRRRPLL